MYVDVGNVHEHVKEVLESAGRSVHHVVLDPSALRTEIAHIAKGAGGKPSEFDWSNAELVLCNGRPPDEDHRGWLWYGPLRDIWEEYPSVRVLDWPWRRIVKRGSKPRTEQVGVDVLLGVKATRHAAAKTLDAIMIVSGDGDLGPAVEECKTFLPDDAVFTAAVKSSERVKPDIRIQGESARRLDMSDRIGGVVQGYAELYALESDSSPTVAKRFIDNLATSDFADARLAAARAYLDAFWWWGSYKRYPFCRALLTNWSDKLAQTSQTPPEERAQAGADRELLDALRQFDARYPVGDARRKRSDPNWVAAEEGLTRVRTCLDAPDSATGRHVSALISFFLGQCGRFQPTAQFDAAADHYGEAAGLFERNGDRSHLAWVHYWWGDLELTRGAVGDALRLAEQAECSVRELARLEGLMDHELMARLAQLRASSIRADSEGCPERPREDGILQLRLALLHTLAFQVRPDSHPDTYTRRFHGEIRHWAETEIRAMPATERSKAIESLVEMWDGVLYTLGEPARAQALLVIGHAHDEIDRALGPRRIDGRPGAGERAKYVKTIGEVGGLLEENGALQ